MVTFIGVPGMSGPAPKSAGLTPTERVALASAPLREDPKRARAFEGGAGHVLGLIPIGEGTPGARGYDTVYGFERYRAPGGPPLTDMTLDQGGDVQREKLARQRRAGVPVRSTAFGKYQFTRDTVSDIQKGMGAPGSAIATPGLQDRMARELLHMDGFDEYLKGRLTPQRFQQNLARRFASFAAGTDDYSYYNDKITNGVKTADIQKALAAAKVEHERYLREDPYIQQRIEEGYMPDTTRWR